MTDAQKLQYLRVLVGEEPEDDLLTLSLSLAKDAIIGKLYPFPTDGVLTMPSRYDYTQVQVAQYLVNNKGTYGLMSHTEQGVTDTFASASIPKDLLADVTPFCDLPSRIVRTVI